MKALLYIRVSTKKQNNDGYSPEEQERALIKYALTNGYEVSDDFVIVENGKSGRLGKNRPGFKRMMQIVIERKCDVVIVHSLSRFARSQEETIRCTRIMTENNVDFISLDAEGAIDTRTPTGKAMLGMMSVFNQLFSDNLSVRIKEAHEYAKENGRKLGQEPFGWKRNGNKMLVEDEREQKIIKLVRGLNKKGLSYQKICGVLEERIIENKAGNVKWFPSQIQKMVS